MRPRYLGVHHIAVIYAVFFPAAQIGVGHVAIQPPVHAVEAVGAFIGKHRQLLHLGQQLAHQCQRVVLLLAAVGLQKGGGHAEQHFGVLFIEHLPHVDIRLRALRFAACELVALVGDNVA